MGRRGALRPAGSSSAEFDYIGLRNAATQAPLTLLPSPPIRRSAHPPRYAGPSPRTAGPFSTFP